MSSLKTVPLVLRIDLFGRADLLRPSTGVPELGGGNSRVQSSHVLFPGSGLLILDGLVQAVACQP